MRKVSSVVVGVLVALSLTAGASSALACPNEAFRVGAGALLPECRAYEMVSPPDKNGGAIRSSIALAADPAGDGVGFFSSTAFAGAPGSPLFAPYVSRLEGGAWTTQSVEAPQENSYGFFEYGVSGSSPDLTKTLQVSRVALTPGAIQGGSNLYLQDNLTDRRQLLAALEGPGFFEATRGSRNLYQGGTEDWSNFLVMSGAKLSPEATDLGLFDHNLFEYRDGALRIANVLPDGSVSEKGAQPVAAAVSSDGSRVTFIAGEFSSGPVYQRVDGTRTIPISASQRAENRGEVVTANNSLAGADGKLVLFTSGENLVEGDETQGTVTLYGYDTATGKLSDLIPNKPAGGAKISRLFGASEDASTAYFGSYAAITPGTVEGDAQFRNIYAEREGQVKFVARLAEPEPGSTAVSANGDYFAFNTFTPLDGNATTSPACTSGPSPEQCLNTYVYDFETGTLACATCGARQLGNSTIGGASAQSPSGPSPVRPVLDDGTVFVETPNQLVPRDVNGINDVYAWREGVPQLISTGTSDQPSVFGTADPSGGNVFFFTAQSLVPIDRDASVDVYDAARLGGLASQFPAAEPGPCEGEACQGSSPTAPRSIPTGSRSGGDVCAARAGAAEAARARSRQLAGRLRSARAIAKARGSLAARRRVGKLRRRAGAASKRAGLSTRELKSCRGGKR